MRPAKKTALHPPKMNNIYAINNPNPIHPGMRVYTNNIPTAVHASFSFPVLFLSTDTFILHHFWLCRHDVVVELGSSTIISIDLDGWLQGQVMVRSSFW